MQLLYLDQQQADDIANTSRLECSLQDADNLDDHKELEYKSEAVLSRKDIYKTTLRELRRVRGISDELDSAISSTRDTHSKLRSQIDENEKKIDETASK